MSADGGLNGKAHHFASLVRDRDDCLSCRYAAMVPYGTGELRMCQNADVLKAFGRKLVAALVAHDDWCGGRLRR